VIGGEDVDLGDHVERSEGIRLERFKIRSLPEQLAVRPGVVKILCYRRGV